MSVSDAYSKDTELHARLAERLRYGLPGHLGIELVAVGNGYLSLAMDLGPQHMAANDYLHAGSIVTLADTACGFGCIANMPADAENFTTVELKSNFLRTAKSGVIRAEARMLHSGRRTQVWDATVYDDRDRTLALFRCTQMLLYVDAGQT